jgi:hypothetical protein
MEAVADPWKLSGGCYMKSVGRLILYMEAVERLIHGCCREADICKLSEE